jgi:cytochrome P450
MTTEAPLDQVDLSHTKLFAEGDPFAVWRRLRAEAPVHWNPPSDGSPGFWSVTRYEDIVAVSRDTATFSSRHGISMSDIKYPAIASRSIGRSLIKTDPPRHGRLRRLVNRAFTPRMVGHLEPRIREIVTEILDAVTPAGRCDFVSDVAEPLPLAVICEMLGLPRGDWAYLVGLNNRQIGAADPDYRLAGASIEESRRQALDGLRDYFARHVAERRATGATGEDLVSTILAADLDGEALTEEEILVFCQLLLAAGNETTRNATSGGMLALVENPDQRARLLADPSLIPSAVEEILRYVSPVMHMARLTTRATEVGGRPIRAGEWVIIWYPSANRDEAVFPDPNRFDVGRTPNEHLAFGFGEHFCLGAGLARLELRVMFEEALRRLPDLELAGPVERLHATILRVIKRMPVRYAPTPAKYVY